MLPAILVSAAALLAWGSSASALWTEGQAESIMTMRGMTVHVRHCDGRGSARRVGRALVYPCFACVAGARLPDDRVDTVAVTYVLYPLGPYRGTGSRYRLANVRYAGLQIP